MSARRSRKWYNCEKEYFENFKPEPVKYEYEEYQGDKYIRFEDRIYFLINLKTGFLRYYDNYQVQPKDFDTFRYALYIQEQEDIKLVPETEDQKILWEKLGFRENFAS